MNAGCSALQTQTHPPLPKLDTAPWEKLHPEPAGLLREAHAKASQAPSDGELVSKLAMTLHALGFETQARAVYPRAIALRPKNAQIAYLHAKLVSEQKAPAEEQIAAWEHAAAANPEYLPARLALLERLLEAKSLNRARALAEEALKTDTPEALSYYWAGRIRRAQADLPAAIQFFLTACDLNPRMREARQALAEAHRAAGENDKADAQEKLLASSRPGQQALLSDSLADPYLDHLHQLKGPIALEMESARKAAAAGRPQEAIRRYLAVLGRDPKHPEAYAKLMQAAYETRQFAAMKEHYQKASEAGIDLPAIHFAWAQALMAQNHTAEAEKLLRNASLREPGNAEIHGQLGAALDKLRRRDDAEASYRKALEIDPKLRDARAGLARLVIGKNPGEAAELFEGSIGGPDHKENAVRLYQLADAYFRLRKYDLAASRATRGRQFAQLAKVPWLVTRLDALIQRCRADRS
ncbi:MAG: tetratricopeptide repeat protein [Bryobacterales bacterium]|nr:tetratricopeptide repeat protein [Bryobacterales bacterium]